MAKKLSLPGEQIPGTNIRVLNPDRLAKVLARAILRIFFDTDGTISLLREGWQSVMGPLMVEEIIGEAEVDDLTRKAIEKAVWQYIDKSTGINTILQMEELAGMVGHYGFVPQEFIMNAQQYKGVYNERLMKSVRQRIELVEFGSLPVDQVTVYRAIDFCQRAAQLAKLHIFSGTDHDDVVNELRVLGALGYFTSVHGALREYKDQNKETVLRKAMAEFGLDGSQLAVIGDGPVELRVGTEAGCLTIGVLSDEKTGRGWNLEKLERLEPYADVIIPDFGSFPTLMSRVLKIAA